MGNTKTEKTKNYKKRKRERDAFNNSICVRCKNKDETVDYTGMCEACRIEELQKECLYKAYSFEEKK